MAIYIKTIVGENEKIRRGWTTGARNLMKASSAYFEYQASDHNVWMEVDGVTVQPRDLIPIQYPPTRTQIADNLLMSLTQGS